MKEMVKKCSTEQRFIRKRKNTYKIGALGVSFKQEKLDLPILCYIKIMHSIITHSYKKKSLMYGEFFKNRL